MTAPRLEIDLGKIFHNATTLVERLAVRGISVTGVTKATLGSPEIAKVLMAAGASGIGDSRVENIERMRGAAVAASMVLIRSPMLSQSDRVVAQTDVSFNTEVDVIRELSSSAQKANRTHGIVLMVELGDLREGIMPVDLLETVRQVLLFSNIEFRGIGTNLACRSGVAPDATNMAELSTLADSIDAKFGTTLSIVSGGNSGNLKWAMSGASIGRINNLRLGESILLGCETLQREPLEGLFRDAFTLVAEVIESKIKSTEPRGTIAQTAFGLSEPTVNKGPIRQSILAIGKQDTDPSGIVSTSGVEVIGSSSDHLILDTGGKTLPIGSEVRFQLNYSALLRAMTSPFVDKIVLTRGKNHPIPAAS